MSSSCLEIPKLKKKTLTQQINLPVDEELKRELYILKHDHQIDVSEWLRQIIKANLQELKNKFKLAENP